MFVITATIFAMEKAKKTVCLRQALPPHSLCPLHLQIPPNPHRFQSVTVMVRSTSTPLEPSPCSMSPSVRRATTALHESREITAMGFEHILFKFDGLNTRLKPATLNRSRPRPSYVAVCS